MSGAGALLDIKVYRGTGPTTDRGGGGGGVRCDASVTRTGPTTDRGLRCDASVTRTRNQLMCCFYTNSPSPRDSQRRKKSAQMFTSSTFARWPYAHYFCLFFLYSEYSYIVEINGLHDGTSLFHEFIHSLHKLRQLDAFPRSPNMKTN